MNLQRLQEIIQKAGIEPEGFMRLPTAKEGSPFYFEPSLLKLAEAVEQESMNMRGIVVRAYPLVTAPQPPEDSGCQCGSHNCGCSD